MAPTTETLDMCPFLFSPQLQQGQEQGRAAGEWGSLQSLSLTPSSHPGHSRGL